MVLKKNKTNKIAFLNSVMLDGKGHLAENLAHKLFAGIQKKTKKDYRLVFKLALKNTLIPVSNISIRKRKRKRKKSYIPFLLVKEKRIYKVIKQICSNTSKFTFKDNAFLNEIIKLANNKGLLKNTLKSTSQLAFLNKNFSHFRWF